MRPNYINFCMLGLALSQLAGSLSAAEVRGTVSLQQAGLFRDGGTAMENIPISVALFPVGDQTVPWRRPQAHDVALRGNRIEPLYVAISRGDILRFDNTDRLYHELFAHAHSGQQPQEVRIGGAGDGGGNRIVMDKVDDWHWFCRIHSKSYARIDVLDTSLIKMVRPGEPFEFRDLAEGAWQVRIAAPGAETRIVETRAITAPPPLQIKLPVKGVVRGGAGLSSPKTAVVEQLFPSEPSR